MEMIPNETIKIKTSDGSIFVFKMEEVEKTEKIEKAQFAPQEPPAVVGANEKVAPSNGPFLIVRVGPIVNNIGLVDEDDENITIAGGIIGGILLNKYMSLGLGVETNSYSFSQNQYSSIRTYPIFLDARFYLAKKVAQPMFSIQFGHALAGDASIELNNSGSYDGDFVPKSGKGGTFFAAGFGVKIKATEKISLVMDGGFSLLSLKGVRSNNFNFPAVEVPTTKTIPSLRINFGIAFNLSSAKS
jgi:hypothetical protein